MDTLYRVIGFQISDSKIRTNVMILSVVLILNLSLSIKYDLNDITKNGEKNTSTLNNLKGFILRLVIWGVATLILSANLSFLFASFFGDDYVTDGMSVALISSGFVYYIVCYSASILAAKHSTMTLQHKKDFYINHNMCFALGQTALVIAWMGGYSLILHPINSMSLSWLATIVYIAFIVCFYKITRTLMNKSIEKSGS